MKLVTKIRDAEPRTIVLRLVVLGIAALAGLAIAAMPTPAG
jgi:hypothetical protein